MKTELEERVFNKILALPINCWRRRGSFFWTEFAAGMWRIQLHPSACGMDPHHIYIMHKPTTESDYIDITYYNYTERVNSLVVALKEKNLKDSNEALETLDRMLNL